METQTQPSTGQRLNQALRWIGTISITASGAIYLFQGLEAMDSFGRFIAFAALTGILAVLGLLAGGKLREDKSARTFLGLAAAATPVLFSQLGAMILALTQPQSFALLPQAMVVTAPSLFMAGVATFATGLFMTPVLYLGFGAFFRANAKQLVLLMLAGSALLLVPTRNADYVAMLLLAQLGLITAYMVGSRRKAAGEMESMIAGTLPLAPVAILIGRQAFYGHSELLLMAVALTFSTLLLIVHPFLHEKSKYSGAAKAGGTLSTTIAWFFLTSALIAWYPSLKELGAMLTIYPAMIALLLFSRNGRGLKYGLREPVAAVAMASPIYSISAALTFGSSLAFLITGFCVAAIGFSKRDKAVHLTGLVTSGVGMVYYVMRSVQFCSAAPWISLAGLGIGAILLAAWLEKNRIQLSQWKGRFDARFRPAQSQV